MQGPAQGTFERRGGKYRELARNLGGDVALEEEEIDNFEYEFNEIVISQLSGIDPQYVIDMETIKEILLLEQKGNLARGWTKLLRSKREWAPRGLRSVQRSVEVLNL